MSQNVPETRKPPGMRPIAGSNSRMRVKWEEWEEMKAELKILASQSVRAELVEGSILAIIRHDYTRSAAICYLLGKQSLDR